VASFFEELRRRKVLRVAGLYLVGAWLILQIADVVIPALFLPNWIISLILYLLVFALPLVLVLAWHLDLTADGLKQDIRDNRRGLKGLKSGIAIATSLAIVAVAGIFFYDYLSNTFDSERIAKGPLQASVAVLPFINLSEDPEQQYFSDGMSDALINALARLPKLHVAARTSSFQFSGTNEGMDVGDIARKLGVATILEGSVRRAGDTVRVTAKLINADDGFQIWSEDFDRKITDVFAIQDEIADAIASTLHVRLAEEGAAEPSVPRAASIDAYNLYLLGRHHFEKRTNFELNQAQRYFEGAIERDPRFAPAYNGLVDSLLLQSDIGYGDEPLEQVITTALPLIHKSLQLDPFLAETHASLGLLRMCERDLLASEAALLRAIELSPNLSRAHVWLYITYEHMAQPKEAFEALQRSWSLDPLSAIVNANMAAEWWIRGRTEEALQAADRVIQATPESPLGYRRSGRIMRTSGGLAEAVSLYRQSLEVAPDDPNSLLELGSLLVDLAMYDEAENLLGAQRHIAYLAQGRVEEALAVIDATLQERPEHMPTIIAAARTESRAGNFNKVRSLLEPLGEESKPGEGPLFMPYGIHFWNPQIPALDLAVAFLETGERESGLSLVSEARRHFSALIDEGVDHPMLRYQEARILALEGRHEEALQVLRQVIAAGWRFWYIDGDPALKTLQGSREFRSIVEDKNRLVDRERAKLNTAAHRGVRTNGNYC